MVPEEADRPELAADVEALEGAAQGAATDAAPQPPAPNTNLVLSVPEPLPPSYKSEEGEGWRGSGPESDKEAGQAVGERGSTNRKKDDSEVQRRGEEARAKGVERE